LKKRKTKDLLIRILGAGIVSLFLFYILSSLFRNLKDLREYVWNFHVGYIILGLLILVLCNLLIPFIWWRIVGSLGGNLTPLKALRIWIISQSGRYVPGKIWSIVGRVALTKDLPKILVLWSMGIEVFFILLSGFGFSMIFLSFWEINVTIPHMKVLYFLPLTLFFLHPKVLEWILAKTTTKRPELKFMNLVGWFFVFVFFWLATCLGHFLFLRGAGIGVQWVVIFALFPLSWILGFLAPFAPGGLGVREGVLTFLLTPSLGPGIASLTALIIRVATTLIDLSLLGIAGITMSIERVPNSSLTNELKKD
jgi:uncharacterized membrane protein YbhN (UPF0104 family)